MININELRIGNLVEEPVLGLVKVHELLNGCARLMKDTTLYSINYENINPIPLSEEILLKCGFDREERGLFIQFANNFNLTWNEIDGLGCGLQWRDYDLFQWGKCNYLHQLQNLYFCLTGLELEINL